MTDDLRHGVHVWSGPACGQGPSERLLEAFARGETTVGGLAEAGWRCLGKMEADGLKFTYAADDESRPAQREAEQGGEVKR